MGEFGRCYAGELPNLEEVPDYLNDLNAMHDVEVDLRPWQHERFRDMLADLVSGQNVAREYYHTLRHYVSAPAAMRAEAYLRIKSLWKD